MRRQAKVLFLVTTDGKRCFICSSKASEEQKDLCDIVITRQTSWNLLFVNGITSKEMELIDALLSKREAQHARLYGLLDY